MRLMTPSLKSLLLPAILVAIPLVATAQQPASSGLDTALNLAIEEEAVGDVFRADLNMDGREEALLVLTEGCDGAACPWRLIGDDASGGGWGVVAAGFGAGTELVETFPEGHVIRSDGVILAWDGAQLLPHHDLLVMAPDRRASAGEARQLSRDLNGSYKPLEILVHELDPFRPGEVWRLFLLDPDGSTPDGPRAFYLLGPDEQIRHNGVSLGRPWLYSDTGPGGAVLRIVSLTREGLLVETVNE